MMERADPLFLLMGLPTIPVVLVLGKMIRWEDYLIRLWHKRNLPPGKQTQTHNPNHVKDPAVNSVHKLRNVLFT